MTDEELKQAITDATNKAIARLEKLLATLKEVQV
jgi:hypothetical protein